MPPAAILVAPIWLFTSMSLLIFTWRGKMLLESTVQFFVTSSIGANVGGTNSSALGFGGGGGGGGAVTTGISGFGSGLGSGFGSALTTTLGISRTTGLGASTTGLGVGLSMPK